MSLPVEVHGNPVRLESVGHRRDVSRRAWKSASLGYSKNFQQPLLCLVTLEVSGPFRRIQPDVSSAALASIVATLLMMPPFHRSGLVFQMCSLNWRYGVMHCGERPLALIKCEPEFRSRSAISLC